MLLKKLEDASCVDASNLAAKRDLTALKVEVNKLDINKLVNFPTGLNDLKTKIDDSDADKLKTVPVDLKKLSDAVSKKVIKKTKFNKLNKKVKNLVNKTDAFSLIQTNQCNIDN